jgi:DNA-binding PadR family transcriptional regulator
MTTNTPSRNKSRPNDHSHRTTTILPDGGTITRAAELNRLEIDILATLSTLDRDERNGQDIKRSLASTLGYEPSDDVLYGNLNGLVGRQLVRKHEPDQRENRYDLTDDGRHLLRERAQWLLGCATQPEHGPADDVDIDPEQVQARADGGDTYGAVEGAPDRVGDEPHPMTEATDE